MFGNKTKATQGTFSILPKENPQDLLPEWHTLSVNKALGGRHQISHVCFGHYIIFHEKREYRDSKLSSSPLFAFDLRDNSIQEANFNGSELSDVEWFTFTKYKDDQIIKLGYKHATNTYGAMERITIEPFKPFTVKCEEINVNGEGAKLMGHTAQIYNDSLYVYGGRNEGSYCDPERNLWCFDLKTLTWTLCQASGEKPEPLCQPSSFLIQGNLYIYGGRDLNKKADHYSKDIFVLNLSSMTWKKLEQSETYLKKKVMGFDKELDGAIYKDHLLFLEDTAFFAAGQNERLFCWNVHTNSWSAFYIQRTKQHPMARGLAVYNNLLLSFGPDNSYRGFALEILNLDYIPLSIPESAEQKQIKSLFMNEEGSDIKLKVQDKIIPAHKQVLTQKSKYFANLFNSGMAESKQDIIEILDCDYPVFQEFLRFLYCEQIQLDETLAFKLLPIADKYVQDDLSAKCMDFLKHNLSTDNVYTILDFARQEDISGLKVCCQSFLKSKIDVNSISGLVAYLSKQNNPEFAQENLELRDKALDIITNNYTQIPKGQKISPTFLEDFLIANIGQDTIVNLVKFISGYLVPPFRIKGLANGAGLGGPFKGGWKAAEEYLAQQEKKSIEPENMNLKAAIYDFVSKNFKKLNESKIPDQFPQAFLSDLLGAVHANQDKSQ